MRGTDELVKRLAEHRRKQLGDLSRDAFAELLRAVQKNPADFIDTPEDEAFFVMVCALARHDTALKDEVFLNEDALFASRVKRLSQLLSACNQALSIDSLCTDAALCKLLATSLSSDALLDALLELDQRDTQLLGPLRPDETGDVWADVVAHGRLRVRGAIARTCMDSARYRMANAWSKDMLLVSPSDYLGARHTAALALARLEDEEGFDSLDVRYGRHGDSWSHLGRLILLYKLGHMDAARRALIGYSRLIEGGAYALLHPVFVEAYIPDRPEARSCSFDEAVLAVFEAEPLIVDVPDLPSWAESVPEVAMSARRFADEKGLDW